jgi:GxxExxY protein
MDLLEKPKFILKNECYQIIGSCMTVHSEIGCGFLEAVYQEALEIELNMKSIPYKREQKLDIYYKDHLLQRQYIADFICYDEIILELKSVKQLDDVHHAQILNYLKVTNKKVGLLVNFGSNSLEYKRFIL